MDLGRAAAVAGLCAVSALFSRGHGGADDPRDVAIGPAAPPGAGGATGAAEGPLNAEPEVGLYAGGEEVLVVHVQQPAPAGVTLDARASDEDGDTVSLSLEEGAPAFVSLAGGASGTASITVDAPSAPPGVHVFYVSAHDGTESESFPYPVVVEAAAGGGASGAAEGGAAGAEERAAGGASGDAGR